MLVLPQAASPSFAMDMVVPDGVDGGQAIQLSTPSGMTMQFIVPPGLHAGEHFSVNVPIQTRASAAQPPANATPPPQPFEPPALAQQQQQQQPPPQQQQQLLRQQWQQQALEQQAQEHHTEACAIAKQAFNDALDGLDQVDDETYKDAALIMQLLKDNLGLWQEPES
jgi:hypothetical protein